MWEYSLALLLVSQLRLVGMGEDNLALPTESLLIVGNVREDSLSPWVSYGWWLVVMWEDNLALLIVTWLWLVVMWEDSLALLIVTRLWLVIMWEDKLALLIVCQLWLAALRERAVCSPDLWVSYGWWVCERRALVAIVVEDSLFCLWVSYRWWLCERRQPFLQAFSFSTAYLVARLSYFMKYTSSQNAHCFYIR